MNIGSSVFLSNRMQSELSKDKSALSNLTLLIGDLCRPAAAWWPCTSLALLSHRNVTLSPSPHLTSMGHECLSGLDLFEDFIQRKEK